MGSDGYAASSGLARRILLHPPAEAREAGTRYTRHLLGGKIAEPAGVGAGDGARGGVAGGRARGGVAGGRVAGGGVAGGGARGGGQ